MHHMVGTHHTTSMLLKIEKPPYDGHSSHPLYWQTLPNLLYGGNLSYDEKASYGGDASYDGGASWRILSSVKVWDEKLDPYTPVSGPSLAGRPLQEQAH